MPKQESYWVGDAPKVCDIFPAHKITTVFVDGRTRRGPWASMCVACHAEYGYGFGTGRGQKYEKQADGRFKKTEG